MKAKRMKLIVFIILPAFFLQGCGVWMSDKGTVRATAPYEAKESDTARAETPYEKSDAKLVKTETGQEVINESYTPAHWEIMDYNGIPPGEYPRPIFDADPAWRVDKTRPNTFLAVEEYAKKNGLVIFKNGIDFPAKMTSAKKRTAESAKIYLIPPGKYILYKPEDGENGDIVLTPVEVASCRNQLVLAPKLKFVPRTKIRNIVRVDKEIWGSTERYLDTKVRTERYLDVKTQVDNGASALWFLGGLASGVGLGYLFWFGSGAAASGPAICPAGACAPGGPAPRPLP